MTRATRVDIQVPKRKKTTTTKRAGQVERQHKLRQVHEPRPVREAAVSGSCVVVELIARVEGQGKFNPPPKNTGWGISLRDWVGGGNSELNDQIIEFTWNWQVRAEACVKTTLVHAPTHKGSPMCAQRAVSRGGGGFLKKITPHRGQNELERINTEFSGQRKEKIPKEETTS